ncbi:hypothetical protein ACN47E_007311 [Coniothyrium glycines]
MKRFALVLLAFAALPVRAGDNSVTDYIGFGGYDTYCKECPWWCRVDRQECMRRGCLSRVDGKWEFGCLEGAGWDNDP